MLGTTATDVGQGLDHMARSVLAGALGVAPALVDVLSGDSRAHDGGRGTFSSRTTIFVANAIMDAVSRLLDEAIERAAAMLGTTPERVARTAEGFVADENEIAWKDLAPLRVRGRHVMDRPTYGFGAHVALVRVDDTTGDVSVERVAVGYDCGHVMDRPSVVGQLVGATAMGIGAALHEALPYDEWGQPQASTLMQYIVPNSGDIPPIDAVLFESGPTQHNPIGVKGAGEAGVVGVGAAIANAVADALGDAGDHVVTELPIQREALVPLHPYRR
jgi:CO/xanthine dehydrogenase Mo-binding subunit